MAYDEKTLKRDGSGITPVPQHFNPTINDYEPIYGRNNAGRVEIYGPDGNPISTDDSNKLAVRASEIETILNEIKSKDFATQTTLAAILAKIISAPATEAKQDALAALIGEAQASPTANTLLARIKSLEDKIDAITSGATPATAQLTGSYATIDSAPVVGVKTVSTTAAELFAGVSRFANRYAMIVYNESSIPVYWGPAGVTTTTGFTLLPQDSVVFQFNPSLRLLSF